MRYSWTDPGGVTHLAARDGGHWEIYCWQPEFLEAVRQGSSKLRIAREPITCLQCTISPSARW